MLDIPLIVIITSVLLVIVIVLVYSRSISSRTLPVIINVIVLYGLRIFQDFNVEEIGIFPLRVVGLRLETLQSRKKPKVLLHWDVMTITIEWRSLSALQGLLSLIAQTESFFGSIIRYISKFTTMKIDLNIPANSTNTDDNLQYKHILQSSSDNIYDKETQKTLLSQCKGSHSYIMAMIVKQVSSLFEIEFNKLTFDINMPNHQAAVNGGASRIRMYTSASGSSSSFGLLGVCHVYKGQFKIYKNGQQAMAFNSSRADMNVDMFIPTGHQEVQMKLQGEQELQIQTEPFLDFYHNYTSAEDNAYEMKMARGMSTNGKMNKMSVSLGEMKVMVSDKRSDTTLNIQISDMNASLETFFLTPSGRKFRVQDNNDSIPDADIVDGCNLFKVMSVELNKLDFQQFEDSDEIAFIDDIKGVIEKTVNFEGQYNDEERMNASVGFVCFEKLSPVLLNWLFILQDVSDNLPGSRFSHFKHTIANFKCQEVRFNIYRDTLPNIKNLGVSTPILDQALSTEVCFFFYKMSATMEKTSNESTSLVTFKSSRLKIDTLLPVRDLCAIYSLDVDDRSNDGVNASKIGCSFDFDTFCMDMTMGASVDFQKLMISEGMTISLINDKTSSPSSSFFKSNIVDGTWQGRDLEVDLGHVDVTASLAGLLKFQLCFDITRQTVDKSLAVMKYIKSKYKSKSNNFIISITENVESDDISSSSSPITCVKMDTFKIASMDLDHDSSVDKSLNINIIIDNFEYKFSDQISSYSWNMFTMYINDFPTKPWMIITDFQYKTVKDTLTVNDEQTEYDNIELKMSEFLIKFSPNLRIGETIALLSSQNDANKLASKNKAINLSKSNDNSAVDTSINDIDDFNDSFVNDSAPIYKPSISKSISSINISKIEFSMEAFYKGAYVQDFMLLSFDSLKVDVDFTKDYDNVNRDIYNLDIGKYLDDNDDDMEPLLLSFDGISGGIVSMAVMRMGLKFKPCKDHYLSMDDFSLKGPLYSASVNDPRIAVNNSYIQLTDTEIYCPRLSIFQTKTVAPGKLYSDLVIVGKSFSIIQVDDTLECINAFNASLEPCLPPNDDRSPSLAWWDSHRYWMHGLFHLKFEQFRLYYVVNTQSATMLTLFAHVDHFQLFNDHRKLECCGQNTTLEVDLDNILLTSHEDISETSRKLAKKHGNLVELLAIPGMYFSLQHERADNYQLLYSHHDVYLESSLFAGNDYDKYSHFRSKKHRINWTIDFHCVDDDAHNPVALYLRLDVIDRIIKAFSASEVKNVESNTTKNITEENPASPPPSPKSSPSAKKTADPSNQISLLDMVRHLNVRLKLKHFVVTSWISRHELVGFVFYQSNMLMDFSMSRHFMKSKAPVQRRSVTFVEGSKAANDKNKKDDGSMTLKMDNLYTDIDIADLYFRDWGVTRLNDISPTPDSPDSLHSPVRDSTKSSLSQADDDGSTREPHDMFEIKELFGPLYKLAHATKVEVELSEEEVHAASEQKHLSESYAHFSEYIIGKEKTKFENVAANTKRKGKEKQNEKKKRFSLTPSDGNIHNRRNRSSSFASPHEKRDSISRADDILSSAVEAVPGEYRPSLFSFQTNHAAMTPPPSSLPISYQKKNRMNEKNIFSSMISKTQNVDDQSIYGRKIWKLRVVDIRLLWSLSLRDDIFLYVFKCLDMFVYTAKNDIDHNNNDSQPNHATVEKTPIKTPKKHSAAVVDFKEIEPISPMSPKTGPTHQSKIEKYFGARLLKSNEVDIKVNDTIDLNSAVLSKRRSGQQTRRSNIMKSRRTSNDGVRKSITGATADKAQQNRSFRYFLVELIDPQVNFLDVKSHSSLIIVSGKSSLGGKRESNAVAIKKEGEITSDPKRRNDIKLQMTGVSAFTVPTMMDGAKEDVVHWKAMDYTTEATLDRRDRRGYYYKKIKTDVFDSPYLKKAIEDFEIKSTYTFYLDVTVKQAKNLAVQFKKDELVSKFQLELPDLIIDIESKQFYMIFDVARNVLLAPPPKRSTTTVPDDTTKKDTIEITRDINNKTKPLNIKTQSTRDELKALIIDYNLSSLKNDLGDTARLVEIYIGKGQWILRSAIDHIAILETEFIGLYAKFINHEDRSTAIDVELQRFWASKNVDGKSDISSSINPVNLTNGSKTLIKKKVVSATIHEEKCINCGETFSMDNNGASACKYHADDDGINGTYSDFTIIDELSGRPTSIKCWSCCGRLQQSAIGCYSTAHRCKDSMISLKIEAIPTTRVENIELTMIDTFNLSIFPEYKLEIEITKDLTDLLHNYFSIDTIVSDVTNELDVDEKEPISTASSKFSDSKTPMRLKRNINGHDNKTIDSNKDSIGGRESIMNGGDMTDIVAISDKRQEGVYIKNMTVGGMSAIISTKGFMFNAEKYQAKIDDYTIKGEVLDFNTLLYRIETNAGLSLVTNTMNKFADYFKVSSFLKYIGIEEKLSKDELNKRAIAEILGNSLYVKAKGVQQDKKLQKHKKLHK